jgi:putative transposase
VSYVEVQYQISERHACRLMGLGRSTLRYRAQKAERDSELRTHLKELAAKRMRFGYRRLTAMLLREGMPANHKGVYRLYRRRRVGNEDSAAAADPLEWRSHQPSCHKAE